mmetsp:Transcript_41541/g.97438  ORF Transcript_41541/g.97438 Transcript_41541/m.97438 type:complete len:406 (-) Transcript_41541:2564-3781(-)|eukprot:CAMPEP_0175986592 /NCGR_PEP_ID=MMETSP0108-20121206/50229_1 /TAXON_ID=195067 ORGANISM="Goniomonas pacifica, Strain CCMP1869" /NCGR_SAMPLE_ID=MMETSP0108 /ASSEMBLY_ACC=CAM_ASM_000204 /LENGTH=405 /DNA_ID=CAMNT_0017317755 /DNA_START=48 /DNA_END=1265 /DNA_ORIENTATION=-
MFAFPPQSVALPDLESSRVFDFEKFRTVTCNAYRRGKVCPFEKRCFFAHGPNELRRNPYASAYGHELCPEAKETKSCPHGPTCHFARNFTEYLYHPKRYKTRLCGNFLSGRCERADTCAFIHNTSTDFQTGGTTLFVDLAGQKPPITVQFVRQYICNPVVALLNSGGGTLTLGVDMQGTATGIDLSNEEVQSLQTLLAEMMSRMAPAPKPDRCLFQAQWEAAANPKHCILKLSVSKGDSSEIYFNDERQALVVPAALQGSTGAAIHVTRIEGPDLVHLCRERFLGGRHASAGEFQSEASPRRASPHRLSLESCDDDATASQQITPPNSGNLATMPATAAVFSSQFAQAPPPRQQPNVQHGTQPLGSLSPWGTTPCGSTMTSCGFPTWQTFLHDSTTNPWGASPSA